MISFIVVTYNSSATIANCLQHILDDADNAIGGEREIIVVDNSSTDNTREIVREFAAVKLIPSQENLGFGGGNQLGFDNSTGEIKVFMNPDTMIQKGFSEKVRDFFAARDDIGIVGCRILVADRTFYKTGNRFPTFASLLYQYSAYRYLFPRSRAHREFIVADWDGQTPRELDAVSGACFVMRRETLQKIGGFDTNYFLYFEEFDLSQRVQKLGLKVVFEPSLSVQHIGEVSTIQIAPEKRQAIYNASCNYYLQKYHGRLQTRLFWIAVGFFNLPKRAISLLRKAKHD